MKIQNKLLKRGFSVNLFKDASIEYQEGIWENISSETKKTIMDNLVYLKLSPYSLFHEEINFNFSVPFLKEFGDKGVTCDMPRIAEEDNVSTKELIERFKNKKVNFSDDNKTPLDIKDINDQPLIGMSFGKDSLLSFGVAEELNMEPELAMVQDFWDLEADHKFDIMERFEKEFKQDLYVVYDSIDDLSSYKNINKTNSSGIVGANAMNSYMMLLLPLAIDSGCGNLVFGNEQNFNDYFINDEGFKVYPSYEQSSEWMSEQDYALSEFTNNKIKMNSFVEPLYNIAEIKVLFNRFPKIAKYQMSCDHSDRQDKDRIWCYSCPMCAKAFIYMKANNFDPKIIRFNENFFDAKFEKQYPLFKSPERIYERPVEVRDEQLFAFYLAYKNNSKGYLIDRFKDNFLKEAKVREDELYNKFFKVHDAVSIRGKVKQEINSIYKEELSKCP